MTLILNDKLLQGGTGLIPVFASGLVSPTNSLYNNEVIITYSLGKYLFYFKLAFVLFLFTLNMYFLFSNDDSLNDSIECKQSTINSLSNILKEYSGIFIAIAGVYTAQLNYKTAISKEETENLVSKVDEHIDKCKDLQNKAAEHMVIIAEASKKVDDANMKFQQVTIVNEDNLSNSKKVIDLSKDINAIIFKLINTNDESEMTSLRLKLQEKGLDINNLTKTISNNTKGSIAKLDEISKIIDVPIQTDNLPSYPQESKAIENKKAEEIFKEDEIQKKSFINFDNYEEWFNNLSIIKQLAISLLISHTVLLSVLINILFIYYGDFIINKFDLSNKYPNLKKVIEYRKKFTRFYLINSAIIIFIIAITYIAFGIAILST